MSLFIDKPAQSGLGYLAEQLGSGFGEGLQGGIDNYFKQKKNTSDLVNAFGKTTKTLFDETGKAYDPATRQKIFDKASDFMSKGYDPSQASILAWKDYLASLEAPEGEAEKEGKGIGQSLKELKDKPITDLLKLFKSPSQAFAGLLGGAAEEPIKAAAQNLRENPIYTPPIPQQQMTPQEMIRHALGQENYAPEQDPDRAIRDVMERGERQVLGAFAKGADPFGVIQRNMPTPQTPAGNQALFEAPLHAFELGGELLKDYLLFKGAGLAKTVPGKVATGGALFGTQKGVKTAVGENRAPTVGEIGGAAAFGAGGELLEPAFKVLSNVFKRVPGLWNKVKDVAKVADVGEKKVVEEAVSSLANRGITVEKIAAGDANAVNELQKEVNIVADRWKQAEKFKRKELEKIREETGKKLAASPLEEYYAPKKEVSHKPETILKEAERVKPLQTKLHQLERSLANTYYSELRTAEALQKARAENAPQAVIDRLEAGVKLDQMKRAKLLNDIKATEFEIKHKKPPSTTEQIKEQIDKTFEELRKSIKDPNNEKLLKVQEQLKKDQSAIELAQKLAARGDLPGKEVFDEFIKIHEQYNKAYGDLIKELKEFETLHKGEKAFAEQVQNAKNLRQTVEQMKKVGEAKVANQIQKRKAMKLIDKPSGAFYRNMLKNLKADVEHFQKSYIKWNQIANPSEAKTVSAAKRGLEAPAKEAEKVAKEAAEAAKNPTQENLLKLEKETGIPHKSSEDFFKSARKEAQEIHGKLEAGKATPADEKALLNNLMRIYKKLPRYQKGIVNGIVLGATQGLLEEYTGYKPTTYEAGLVASIASGGRSKLAVGTGVVAGMIFKRIHAAFDNAEAQQLKKRRNTPEFQKYRLNLEERYGKTRANKIVKKATER